MKQQKFLAAFKNAFNGLWYFFLHERNGKIQCCAAVLVVILAAVLGVTATQWIILLLCIGAVLSLEMINSAVEKLCDIVHEDYHPVIKIIKDVSAAAVLFTSIISAVIGIIIFLPKIISL